MKQTYILELGAQSRMEIIGIFMKYNDNLYSFVRSSAKKVIVRLRKKHRKLILEYQILQTDKKKAPPFTAFEQCSAVQ